MAMLEVKDLQTSFFTPAGEVKAVNGISFNLDSGKVLGIAFTELEQTPGLGTLANEPAFKDQFANKQVTQFVHNKGGAASGDNVIDAISGASTTSGAVVNAVNAGLDFFRTYMQGGE